MKEIKIEDSIIFSQVKCFFLFTLEEFNDEYISKKYKKVVIEEFNKSIKNFSL